MTIIYSYTGEKMPALIELAIQESNDIESHGSHKVNSPEDLVDSLIAWEYLSDRQTLTLADVKVVHWLITRNQLPPGQRGTLRSDNGVEVEIAGRKGLQSALVTTAMHAWLEAMPKVNPVDSHVYFEHIHPFVDGNGRTGRLIYYWQLARIGQFNANSIIYDKDRHGYYEWF